MFYDLGGLAYPPITRLLRFIMWLPAISFAFSLILSAPLAALAGEASDSFSRGVKVANTDDYKNALKHFLQARKQGLEKPALDYNLGVAYYRLGRYGEAHEAFTRLVKAPKFTHLAYFNLGLIANKTGNTRSANNWFLRTYHNTTDRNLKALSAKALKRLGIDVKEIPTMKKWSGFVTANAGYDSNVKQANEDLVGVVGESDNSFEIMGVGNYWLRGGREEGVRLSFSADVQKYQTLNNDDFSQFHLGLSRFGRLGNWRMRFTGSWHESYLGGNNYQRIFSGEARGRHGLGDNKYLHLRYRLNYITATDTVFEALDGWRHQLRAGIQVSQERHRFRGYYQLELNDRNDRDSGTRFTSFSPTRHAVRGIASLRLNTRWQARLDARYRYSAYNDPSDISGVGIISRVDKQIRLGARLGRSFTRQWEIEGRYNYYDNRSNIDAYSYKRSVIFLGINRFF